MLATSTTRWAREAWKRAGAAQTAQIVSVRISDERVIESSLRLNRSHERLKRGEPRVARGRQRKV